MPVVSRLQLVTSSDGCSVVANSEINGVTLGSLGLWLVLLPVILQPSISPKRVLAFPLSS